MAKKTQTYWRKKADKEWSRIIRSVGYCEICHSFGKMTTTGLVAHHLIEKGGTGASKFRHDLSNGICVCRYHHTMGKDITCHGGMRAVEAFIEWLKEHRFGQYTWYEINKENKQFIKMDYEEIYNELKEIDNDNQA